MRRWGFRGVSSETECENDDAFARTGSTGLAVRGDGVGPEGYRANVRTFIRRILPKFRDIDDSFKEVEEFLGTPFKTSAFYVIDSERAFTDEP